MKRMCAARRWQNSIFQRINIIFSIISFLIPYFCIHAGEEETQNQSTWPFKWVGLKRHSSSSIKALLLVAPQDTCQDGFESRLVHNRIWIVLILKAKIL